MANAPLPGSAAAAEKEPKATATPVADKLKTAQQAEAAQAKKAEEVATTRRDWPTVGRIVHYVAPDQSRRAALVTYVWEQEAAPPGAVPDANAERKQVNLLVFGLDHADTQLARQTALVGGPQAGLYYALNVPFQDPKNPREVHTWVWPVLR